MRSSLWNYSPPGLVYFRDDFNRSNNSSLGSDWRNDSNGSQIISNAAQAKTVGSNTGRQAAGWQTYQGSWNGGKYLTDGQGVRAQLKAPSTAAAGDNFTVIYLGGPDTFGASSGFVALCVTTVNGCGIYTQTGSPNGPGGSIGGTQRASTATTVSNTDIISLEKRGQVYTAYKNGSTFGLSWTDSGNVATTGSANRRFGFCLEANYPIFNQQFSSPGIDWIEAYDLAA